MIKKTVPVTICIPVKNEQANIARCLKALERFDDIYVVDSNSSDSTCTISESFGAKVLQFKWDGKNHKKRNWFLSNSFGKYQWVFFLDADEVLNENFVNELYDIIHKGTHYSGFWISYQNYFMGKKMKFGDRQKKLALFRRDKGMYEKVIDQSTSHLDMEIHEHPIINGAIGRIKSVIDHHDFKGLDHFMQKHIEYAKWEAQRFLSKDKYSNSAFSDWTIRQKVKYKILSNWLACFAYFIYSYVFRLGFLDGRIGFSYAFYKMWYFHLIYCFIKIELQKLIKDGK